MIGFGGGGGGGAMPDAVVQQQPAAWRGEQQQRQVAAAPSGTQTAAIDLTAGTVAGVAQLIVGYPFDTIKVKLQSQSSAAGAAVFNGPLDAAKQVGATIGQCHASRPTRVVAGRGAFKPCGVCVSADAGQGGHQGHVQGHICTTGHCCSLQRSAVCLKGTDGDTAQTRRR